MFPLKNLARKGLILEMFSTPYMDGYCLAYRKISNIRRTNSLNVNDSHLVLPHLIVAFAQAIEARFKIGNEDVVGAAPTGDAPTTSEWSTILLLMKMRFILKVWR